MAWASSFEREWFGVSGCSVLDRAESDAHELGHYWLGSEHLLLGVLHAWPALRDLGGVGNLSIEEVRAHIRRVDSPGRVNVEQLEVTARARLIVSLAREQAIRRGSLIDPQCVWFGIAREGEGVAMRVLIDLGVSGEMIDAAIGGVIIGGASRPQPRETPADLPRRVQAELERLEALARAAALAAEQAVDPEPERSLAHGFLEDALKTLQRLELIGVDAYVDTISRVMALLYPPKPSGAERRSALLTLGEPEPRLPRDVQTAVQDMLFFHLGLAQGRARLRQGAPAGSARSRRGPRGQTSYDGMFAVLVNLGLLSADELAYWRKRFEATEGV
jgi:hypothetical protein